MATTLAEQLAALGLRHTAAHLDDVIALATKRRWSTTQLLEHLVETDWPTVFPNAATATALIDRLVHHADILTLEGDSYRRRIAEAKRKSSRPPGDG